MDETLRSRLRRFYSEEQIRIMDLTKKLGFHASSIDPKVLKNIFAKDFDIDTSRVEWLAIDNYSLTANVLFKIKAENKVLASPIEFISAVLKIKKIKGVRIGLMENGHLVVKEDIQRTIGSILAGDGFAPCCLFAVKSR